jgi:hypothetical protein
MDGDNALTLRLAQPMNTAFAKTGRTTEFFGYAASGRQSLRAA